MPREAFLDESGIVAEVTFGEHHLQLATLHTDPATFVAWCRQIVEEHDKHKAAASSTPRNSTDTRLFNGDSMGMFWSPTRPQVNELIRALRRGRDRVWGADE